MAIPNPIKKGSIRVQLFLLAAVAIASVGFFQPVEYDNTKSRLMLVGAIVDEGRLSIDSFHQSTVDKSYFAGHYYTIKAIGLPFLAVPLYWGIEKLIPAAPLGESQTAFRVFRFRYLLIILVVGLPYCLLTLLLYQFLLQIGEELRPALWTTIAFALGTITLNNAILFSGHDSAAVFAFAAFFCLFRLERDSRNSAATQCVIGFLAGAAGGLAVLCDYIAAFVAVPLACYAASLSVPRLTKAAFFSGAGVCALALAAYNHACFGSFHTLSYVHLAPTDYKKDLDFGYVGFTGFDLSAFGQLIGSPSRGLMFISPVLLYSIPGFIKMRTRLDLRKEWWFLLSSVGASIIAVASYRGWHGGVTFGPRYLVPMLPFLAVPMAFVVDQSATFFLLLALSVLQVAVVQLGCPHVFMEIQNPIVEFVLPLLRVGVVTRSWAGRLPFGEIPGGLIQLFLAAALTALAIRETRWTPRRRLDPLWTAGFYTWAAWVVLALALIRTGSQSIVRWRRFMAIHEYATVFPSRDLESAEKKELSGTLVDRSANPPQPTSRLPGGSRL